MMKIAILGRKLEAKETKNKFIAFSAYDKENQRVNVKFADDITGDAKPKEAGLYTLEFDEKKSSISKDSRGYRCLWVHGEIKVTKGNNEFEEKQAERLRNTF